MIEAYYGPPQDIEWAIDRDLPFPENVFMVQSRREAVWSQRKKEAVLQGKSAMELTWESTFKNAKPSSLFSTLPKEGLKIEGFLQKL